MPEASRRARPGLVLLGLVLVAAVLAPSAAQAQTSTTEGWTGYITATGSYDYSNDQQTLRGRIDTTFTLDGTGTVNDLAADSIRWEQPADWAASFQEFAASSCSYFDGPLLINDTTNINRNGQGTGNGTVVILLLPDKYALEGGAGPNSNTFPVQVQVRSGCPGLDSDLTDVASPCAVNIGSQPANPDGLDATVLSGSAQYNPCRSDVQNARIDWYLTRGPNPPECADGRDNDQDGFTDYAGANPRLRDPGCQSNQDDSEANGTIIIDKQTQPVLAPDRFGFSGPTGPFTLTGDAEPYRIEVEPGSHQITEDPLVGEWRLAGLFCDDSDSTTSVPARTATVQVDASETVRCFFINRQPLSLELRARYRYRGVVQDLAASADGFDQGRVLGEPEALARVGQICIRSFWTARAKLTLATTTPLFWNGNVGPFEDPAWTLISRTLPNNPRGTFRGEHEETIQITSCGPQPNLQTPQQLVVNPPGLRMKKLTHWNVVELYDPAGRLLGSLATEAGSFSARDFTENDHRSTIIRLP